VDKEPDFAAGAVVVVVVVVVVVAPLLQPYTHKNKHVL